MRVLVGLLYFGIYSGVDANIFNSYAKRGSYHKMSSPLREKNSEESL